MGQYHVLVNLDKRQYVDPHKLGDGLKLAAQHGLGSTSSALHLLLAVSSGRGGGDYQSPRTGLVGSWGGDRIAVIGDYAEPDDLAGCDAAQVYSLCQEGDEADLYEDITDALRPIMEREFEVVFVGGKRRVSLWDHVAGVCYSHGVGDREFVIAHEGREMRVPASVLREAVRSWFESNTGPRREPLTVEELGLTEAVSQ